MLPVSAEWKQATKEQFRNQAYLTATLIVAPPGMRDDITTTLDGKYPDINEYPYSNVTTITDGQYSNAPHLATLEANRWLLDGSYNVRKKGQHTAVWWSKKPLSKDKPLTLHFKFGQPYSFPGIFFAWDTVNHTYPDKIIVTGFDSTGKQVYNIETRVYSSTGFISDCKMENVSAVDITILQWSINVWLCRIDEILFGEVLQFSSVNNGRIVSAKQISKASPLSKELPAHEFELSLSNTDMFFDPTLTNGVSKFIMSKQIARVQWSFKITPTTLDVAPEQMYIVDGCTIPGGSGNVTIKLTNRLSLLDSDFTRGYYTGGSHTLYEIADYILRNSDVFKTNSKQTPWLLSPTLRYFETTAPIPAKKTNQLLQLIALASNTWLSVDGMNGFITYKVDSSLPAETCEIGKQQGSDPTVSVNDALKSIKVNVYHYTIEPERTSVGTTKFTFAGVRTLVVKYQQNYATVVTYEVTGATVLSFDYYASYAEITLDSGPTDQEVEVKLFGLAVTESVTTIETYSNPAIKNGKSVEIDNPFITSEKHALAIAKRAQEYYERRTAYSIKYLGYPQVEAADKCTLTTKYGATKCSVTENSITYNGGWSGNIELV